jgi:hypothetical protein
MNFGITAAYSDVGSAATETKDGADTGRRALRRRKITDVAANNPPNSV